jgi:hypothetical protein
MRGLAQLAPWHAAPVDVEELHVSGMEAGYVRREPSAAADYLRSVGLVGPFWGT